MTDTLQTKNLLEGRFVSGEQPHPEKLSILNALYQSVLEEIKAKIGSVDGANNGGLTTESGNAWFATRSPSWYKADGYDLDMDVATTELQDLYNQMVSVARLLGPAAALNPQIIGQQTWDAANQGAGWPIEAGVHIQQLPFRPNNPSAINSANFSPLGGGDIPEYPGVKVFDTLVASLSDIQSPGDFFIDAFGFLASYSPCDSATSIVYDYSTDLGDQYINAGYNVIPDPSILKLSEAERAAAGKPTALTDGVSVSYKACELSYVSGLDTPVFKIVLPEVISTHESVLTGESSLENFEPGGTWNAHASIEAKQYLLPEVYERDVSGMAATKILSDNTLFLWDASRNKIIKGLTFTIDPSDQLDNQVRVIKASGPAYLISSSHPERILNDSDLGITGGGLNTKDYFLLCIGTQVTPLLSQHSKNIRHHNHDGVNSSRVEHSALAGNSGHSVADQVGQVVALEDQEASLPSQFESKGLTDYFVRSFFGSFINGNDHAQYFHRLGFRGGGTDGFYSDEDANPVNMANMFMGDIVLGPTQNSSNDPGYSWESGDVDLNNVGPGHSLWFGVPDVLASASGGSILRSFNGSVRAYFDGAIEGDETEGASSTVDPVSLRGIAGGTGTGVTGIITHNRKGLNLQRGHFFFGFNEHKSSLLGVSPGTRTSASWLASDFNVVVTANRRAGVTGQSGFKGQVNGPRDGYLVRATDGASIYHGIGGTWDVTPGSPLTTGHKSNANFTGAYTMEAGFGSAAFRHTGKDLYSNGSAHGALFLASPGLGSLKYFPWQNTITEDYAGWSRQDDLLATETENRGGFFQIMSFSGKGSVDKRVPTSTSSPTQSVLGPRSLPWGRGVIGGTLGLDIVVGLQTKDAGDSTGADVLNPFNTDLAKMPWKPEVRFWSILRGDRYLDDAEDRESVHAGANANFMYGHGKDYDRFNINAPWSDTVISGRTSEIGNARTISDPGGVSLGASLNWTRGRVDQLHSASAEDYGSNLRQVSTIEAFNGIRSDPSQPYISTYKVPFRIKKAVPVEDFFQINAIMSTLPISHSGDGQIVTSTFYANNKHWGIASNIEGRFVDQSGFYLFIDQLIRWHDAKLSKTQKVSVSTLRPGSSIAGYKCDLDYFYFASANTSITSIYDAQGDTVGSDPNDCWAGISSGDVKMVKVGQAGWSGTGDTRPHPVRVGSGFNNGLEFSAGAESRLHPYSSYLALSPIKTGAGSTTKEQINTTVLSNYYNGFRGYNDIALQYHDDGNPVDYGWSSVLSCPEFDSSNGTASDAAFPYKVSYEAFAGPIGFVIEMSGVITLEFQSLNPYTEIMI